MSKAEIVGELVIGTVEGVVNGLVVGAALGLLYILAVNTSAILIGLADIHDHIAARMPGAHPCAREAARGEADGKTQAES